MLNNNANTLTIVGASGTGTGSITLSSVGGIAVNNTLTTTGVGGYLDMTAGGSITQSGALNIAGDLWARTSSGNISLNLANILGATSTVSLIAPLFAAGAGEVSFKANLIKVGTTVAPSDLVPGSTNSGIKAARVTIEAPTGGAILADGTQGLITADAPFSPTTPSLSIIANGIIGDPATATPTTVGLWVQTEGLVVVDGNAIGDGTVMLFGDETHQPKYEFSGDPTHRSVKYNGVEATNAQLTGALDAAYLDIRNQTTEIRESGFAKENASKVLRRGVVTSAGPGQPAVDDSTGLAGMELCDGIYGNDALACQ